MGFGIIQDQERTGIYSHETYRTLLSYSGYHGYRSIK